MSNSEKWPAWKKALAKKIVTVKHVLDSPDGAELLAILKADLVTDDLRGETVYETYYNLGRRDVVKFLINMRDAKLEDPEMYDMGDEV